MAHEARLTWRKSSYSAENNCVEVVFGRTVAVRDSKNPAGPILTVSEAAWRSFLSVGSVGFLSAPSRRDPA